MAVAVALLLVAACGSGTDSRTGTDNGTGVPGTVDTTPVPVSELEPRWYPALAWTGSEVFVFGGSEAGGFTPHLESGALVAPDLASMVPLPPPPFPAPLEYPVAVTLGGGGLGGGAPDGEVLVVGVTCAPPYGDEFPPCDPGNVAAATFDLASHTWETVELPPELAALDETPTDGSRATVFVDDLGVASDGQAVLVVGETRAVHWRFDAATREWTALPPPPVAPVSEDDRRLGFSSVIAECLSGDTLVVMEPAVPHDPKVSGSGDGEGGVRTHVLDVVAGGDWVTLADAPQVPGDSELEVACAGSHVVATDGATAGTLVDITGNERSGGWQLDLADGTWSDLPRPADLPMSGGLPPGPFVSRLWTGTELLLLPLGGEQPGLAYDPVAGTWRALVDVPGDTITAMWAGDRVVAVPAGGSSTVPDGTLFSYVPATR